MTDVDTSVPEEVSAAGSLSSAEGTSKQRRRLRLLLAAHVVLGLLFAIWSAAQGRFSFSLGSILIVPVVGFVFAQIVLLGFWTVFAPVRWWKRLAGLVLGVFYLAFLIDTGAQADNDFNGLPVIATGGIAAIFAVIRWWLADLRRYSEHVPQSDQDGLKFSIRGLLLFTLVVAVTVIAVSDVRENAWKGRYVLAIVVWSASSVIVALAGVWAGLGLARPTRRSIAVLLMSAGLGTILFYSINLDHWEMHFYVTSITLLYAALLIASMLVVRSCGYRLVRKRASSTSQ